MDKKEIQIGLTNYLEYSFKVDTLNFNFNNSKSELENQYNLSGNLDNWLNKRIMNPNEYQGNDYKKYSVIKETLIKKCDVLDNILSYDTENERILLNIKQELPRDVFNNIDLSDEGEFFNECANKNIDYRESIDKIKKRIKNINKKPILFSIFSIIGLLLNYMLFLPYIFLFISLILFLKRKEALKKINSKINEIIVKHNHICYEISKRVNEKIDKYFCEKSQEYGFKLKELKNNHQEDIKKVEEQYIACEIKLPNEIISMYEKLGEEEQDLFVTLARNAESEKEFSNIYVQCINAKNNRKAYDEQRKQTSIIQKQAMSVEEEYKKQTRIMKERADQERIHMENVERQNKELLRKQDEANKIAEKTAKMQNELARKSVNSLRELEYQTRLANDKSSDYYRGNR